MHVKSRRNAIGVEQVDVVAQSRHRGVAGRLFRPIRAKIPVEPLARGHGPDPSPEILLEGAVLRVEQLLDGPVEPRDIRLLPREVRSVHGRNLVADRDGRAAPLGDQRLADVIHDVDVEARQCLQGAVGPIVGELPERPARQELVRAVRAVIDDGVGSPHLPQPPIHGQVLMRRRDPVVVLQLGVHARAAHGLGEHDDVAEVQLGNHEVRFARAFDGHQPARRRPERGDHFVAHPCGQALEPAQVAAKGKQFHAFAAGESPQVARPSSADVAAEVKQLRQQRRLVNRAILERVARVSQRVEKAHHAPRHVQAGGGNATLANARDIEDCDPLLRVRQRAQADPTPRPLDQDPDPLRLVRLEPPTVPRRFQALDQRGLDRAIELRDHGAHDQARVANPRSSLPVGAERLPGKQQGETAQDRHVQLVSEHFDPVVSEPPPAVLPGNQDVGAVLDGKRRRLRRAENGRGVEAAALEGAHHRVGRLVHAQPPAIRKVNQNLGSGGIETARRCVPPFILRRGRELAGRIRMVVAVIGCRLGRQLLEVPTLITGRRSRQQASHVGHPAVAPVIVDPAVSTLEVGVPNAQARGVVSGQRDHAGACCTGDAQCLADRARQWIGPSSADVHDAVTPEVGLAERGVVDPLRTPVVKIHAAQLSALRQEEAVHARKSEKEDAGTGREVECGRCADRKSQADGPQGPSRRREREAHMAPNALSGRDASEP